MKKRKQNQLQKVLFIALTLLSPMWAHSATTVPTASTAPIPGTVAMGNIKEYNGCQLHENPLFDYANSDNGYILFDVQPTVTGTYSFTASIATGTGNPRYCTLGPVDGSGNYIAGVSEKTIPAGIDGTDWTKSKADYVWTYDLTAGSTYTIKIGYRRNGEPYGVNVYTVNVTTNVTADYTVTYYNQAYTTPVATYTVLTSQPYNNGAVISFPAGKPAAPNGMMFDHWAKDDGTVVNAGDLASTINVYPVWTPALVTVGETGTTVKVEQVKKWNNCVAKGSQLIDSSHDGSYIQFDVKATSEGYYTFSSDIATTLNSIRCALGYTNLAGVLVTADTLAITNTGSWTTTSNYKWLFKLKADTTYTFKMLCFSTGSYCLNAFNIGITQFIADVTLKGATVNGYAVISDNGTFGIDTYYDEDISVIATSNVTTAKVTYTAVCNDVPIGITTDGVISKSAFNIGDVVKVTVTIKDGPEASADYVIVINVNDSKKKQIRGTVNNDGYWTPISGSSAQAWTDYIYSVTPTASSSLFSNGTWTPTGGSTLYCFYANNASDSISIPTNFNITAVSFIGYGAATLGLSSTGATVTPNTSTAFDVASGINQLDEVKFTLTNHTPGSSLKLTVSNTACRFYIVLSYKEVADVNAPTLVAQNISENALLTNINGYFSLRFNEAIQLTQSALATINGTSVKLKLENNVFVNQYYHGLEFESSNTFVLKANSVEDMSGNKNATDITIHFSIDKKPLITKKVYDFIVGVNGTIEQAIVAANSAAGNARYYIFVPVGTHELPGNGGDHMTNLNRSNVSIIGQSKDNTIICNTPLSNGISNTATIHLNYATKTYMEDLTLKNNKGEAGSGVEVALYDRGSKNTFKNVKLFSYQDTYVTGDRGYLDDCDIYGSTDYICGAGSLFFDSCLLYNRAASGNKITAPATAINQLSGYVFSNCTVQGGNYVLGRPWQNEPRAYFLNTKMNIQPSGTGWEGMSNLITHFYEYNSMDLLGNAVSLAARGNSPSSVNTYTPVLTGSEASDFDLYSVVGGTDGWMPSDLTIQVKAPDVTVAGNKISWTNDADALCTVIFKNGVYLACTIDNSYDLTENGTYTIQSANEMGGLGYATTIEVTTTGIKNIVKNNVANPGKIYDLMGRQLKQIPEKGFYIIDGVKYYSNN